MISLPVHDLRPLPTEQLLPKLRQLWQTHPNGFWSVARKPGRRWTGSIDWARALVLSSAPLFELILWTPAHLTLPVPDEVLENHRFLLTQYRELFLKLKPSDEAVYLQRLEEHIRTSESDVYHVLEELPHVDRAIRELRYERQGLRRGLEQMCQALAAARTGCLEKACKEKLDLDFYHLLEHHLEREKDAVYPSWVFLKQG